MAKIKVHRNYRFIDKDPIMDALRTIRNDEKLTNYQMSQITGIVCSTYDGWFDGTTRKPQNATSTQTAAALGYVRRDELKEDGQVIVGFVKARTFDYKMEAKKQADWLLKQGRGKKPRARKKKAKNGKG